MPNSLPPLEHGIDMPDNRQSGTTFTLEEPFKEGGFAIMPLKSAGLPDPNRDGLIGAFSYGPNESTGTRIGGPSNSTGGNMVWDGTWVIAIGK